MVEKLSEVAPGGIETMSLRLPWRAMTVKAVSATPVESEAGKTVAGETAEQRTLRLRRR